MCKETENVKIETGGDGLDCEQRLVSLIRESLGYDEAIHDSWHIGTYPWLIELPMTNKMKKVWDEIIKKD